MKQKNNANSKDIPIAALAVTVAKELLHETSESPKVLAATPRSLSRSLNNLGIPSIVTHLCDDDSSSSVPSRRKEFELYPYLPLTQFNDDEG